MCYDLSVQIYEFLQNANKIVRINELFFLSGRNLAKCCKSFRGLEGLGAETIRFPTGNVVFNVIGNAAPFRRVAYDVFVETGLPSKRYLIGVGKTRNGAFHSANGNGQPTAAVGNGFHSGIDFIGVFPSVVLGGWVLGGLG